MPAAKLDARASAILRGLAAQFEDGGQPLQAIKCYEAALSTPGVDPPRVEAAARLACARLLLSYTGCTRAATAHLERARLALEGARGAGAARLKLGVASRLAACQAAGGAGRAAHATLDGGAAIVAADLPAGPEAAAWRAHLLTSLAASASAAGDGPTAARAAGRMASAASASTPALGSLERAALALACAGTAAAAGRTGEAESALGAACDALDAAERAGEGAGESGGPAAAEPEPSALLLPPHAASWAALLRLQAETLRVSLALATGEIKGLLASLGLGEREQDAVAAGLARLGEAAAGAVQGGGGGGGPPAPAVGAAVAAASAAAAGVLRPLAKFGPATVHALRGLEAADDGLRSLGVLGSHFASGRREDAPPDALAPEASVAPHVRAAAAPLVRAKLLLLDARARCALSTTDLAGGRRAVGAALALADAWPGAATPLLPALLELGGHYALCTRDARDAARLFGAAAARAGGATGAAAAAAPAEPGAPSPPPPPAIQSPATYSAGSVGPIAARATAGALAAIAELADEAGRGGGPTARATAALKAGGLLPDLPPGLPRAAKATARLAVGLVSLAAGDAPSARVALSGSLSAAQNVMSNTCLISAGLVALAPSQAARGDRPGAEGMLEAAFTLAKGSLDVATQLAAAAAKRVVLAGGGGEEDEAVLVEMSAFVDRKAGVLDAATAAATDGEGAAEHKAVVGWGSGL